MDKENYCQNEEIAPIQDLLEYQNNFLYERSRNALIVCDLMKTAFTYRLEMEQSARYEFELETELENTKTEMENIKNELSHKKEEVEKLVLDNTRFSNELMFLRNSSSMNVSSNGGGSGFGSLALSKSDRIALKKISELAQDGNAKEKLMNEAEQIMKTRRLTLHNLRQSKRIESVEILNSLRSLLDKVSGLERELEVSSKESSLDDGSSYLKQIMFGMRNISHKMDQMKRILNSFDDLEAGSSKFDQVKEEMHRSFNSFSLSFDTMRKDVEKRILTNSSGSVLASNDHSKDRPFTPPPLSANFVTDLKSSLPVRNKDLLDQIKTSSIRKLRKSKETLTIPDTNLSANNKSVAKRTKTVALKRVYEIQDSLKDAIEKHRNAMMMEDQQASTESDEDYHW